MSSKPWHRRYHSDALSGFMSLSLEERGAYQTVLDLIYDRRGPIPDNPRFLSGYMGCSLRKWASIREKLIAAGKIAVTEDGLLTNFRAEKELENDAKTSRKHAENGSKGGRNQAENAKKGNENNGGDEARLKPGSSLNQKPEARGQIKKKAKAKEESPQSPWPPELVARAEAVRSAVGMRAHPSSADFRQLQAWDRDGLNFDLHVLEGARAVARKAEIAGRRVGSFAYLNPGIREYAADWQADVERFRVIAGGRA